MLFELDRIKAKKIYYKRILLKQIVKDTSKANSKKNEKIYIICLCFLMFFIYLGSFLSLDFDTVLNSKSILICSLPEIAFVVIFVEIIVQLTQIICVAAAIFIAQ
jgi:hypothetical protein